MQLGSAQHAGITAPNPRVVRGICVLCTIIKMIKHSIQVDFDTNYLTQMFSRPSPSPYLPSVLNTVQNH